MANDGTVRIGTELDDSGFKAGLSKLGSVASGALTGLTASVSAASVAVGVLSKQSLDAYASYEQLVGGVETLFGTGGRNIEEYAKSVGKSVSEVQDEYNSLMRSQQTVLDNAANAYKTAGVSANTYMEQATAFSASLIQSLGGDTEAAAQYANQAIMDMSDNANKMGTDIEVIQQTYQSLMRGNYAMLDNLKLGYGGTKSELERLVAEAEKLTGQALDPAKFSDVIIAINAIQKELGITGTTALEASTTIEGSLNSARAAFENLLVGIADDNADLDTLIDNFVTTASSAASNILPRFEQILSGFGELINQFAPIIAERLPAVLVDVLPSLVSAGAQLVVGLANGIITALPALLESVPQIINSVVVAIQDSSPSIMESGGKLLKMIADGIIFAIPYLIERLPDVILSILDFIDQNLPTILQKGSEFIEQLAFGILDAIPVLVSKLPEVISAFTEFFVKNFPQIVKTGGELLGKLIVGILGTIPEIYMQLPQVLSAIVEAFSAGFEQIRNVGAYLIEGLWNGISDKVGWLKDKVLGVVDTIKGWFTGSDGFDTHSPSKWSEKIGGYVDEGLAVGMEKGRDKVKAAALDIVGAASALKNAIPYATIGVSSANSAMAPIYSSTPKFSTENAIDRAAGMISFAQSAQDTELVLEINGREFARAVLPDIRSVDNQSPQIV